MPTDFSSIDRLVEFGMGLTLAQQMVNTMNHTMDSMKVPGVSTSTTGRLDNEHPGTQWYVVVEQRQAGPLSDAEMEKLVSDGLILDNTLIWKPGMTAWKQARDIAEINRIFLLNRK